MIATEFDTRVDDPPILADSDTLRGADSVSDKPTGQAGIPALIIANLAMIITVIFGAGVTYARVGTVEVRVGALEARENQLDELAAIQAELKILKEEVMRARDRLDRGLDATTERRLK